MGDDEQLRVECRECRFSEVVSLDADVLPGEVLVAHARETGHKLSLTPVEDAD